MKTAFMIILLFMFIVNCSTVMAIKQFAPVLKMIDNNNAYSFHIPDSDNLGWNVPGNNEGEDTITITNTVFLEQGSLAYIEAIEYDIYSNNQYITGDSYNYLMPILIEENDTLELEDLNIILTERDAYQIDIADGKTDFNGNGFIELTIHYYDNINNNYSTVPIRYEFTVSKP